jgi:hypothetical protein
MHPVNLVEIIMSKSKPSDFYFVASHNREDSTVEFVVTSKSIWDKSQHWDDRSCTNHKLFKKHSLYELMESVYETDQDPVIVIAGMKAAGFIWNPDLVLKFGANLADIL